jgi:hypothetical protein
MQFRSLKQSIADVNAKLQRCIAEGARGSKETELRADLQLLHVKLLALRNNPTQMNHVVWRTNRPREKAKVHSDVAHGLALDIEPRSFEHALQSLLFIIHRHRPTGERSIESPPLFMPQALQQQQQQQQRPSASAPTPQQLSFAGDSRSAFKRMHPTPALNPVLVGVLSPSQQHAAKRTRITGDDDDDDSADNADTTTANNDDSQS